MNSFRQVGFKLLVIFLLEFVLLKLACANDALLFEGNVGTQRTYAEQVAPIKDKNTAKEALFVNQNIGMKNNALHDAIQASDNKSFQSTQTTETTERKWYTAQELRAQQKSFEQKMPYDFGLGVVIGGDVSDAGEVSVDVKMKRLFTLMPKEAQEQFILTSLEKLHTRYCKDANNPKKRLYRVRAIRGIVTNYRGKIILQKTYNPAMCGV